MGNSQFFLNTYYISSSIFHVYFFSIIWILKLIKRSRKSVKTWCTLKISVVFISYRYIEIFQPSRGLNLSQYKNSYSHISIFGPHKIANQSCYFCLIWCYKIFSCRVKETLFTFFTRIVPQMVSKRDHLIISKTQQVHSFLAFEFSYTNYCTILFRSNWLVPGQYRSPLNPCALHLFFIIRSRQSVYSLAMIAWLITENNNLFNIDYRIIKST